MIQNKMNNLASIAIFLLHNKMLSMTGNQQSFFRFTSHLSVYLLVNLSYIVWKSTSFKITFEISILLFYTGKIIRNAAHF